VDLNARPAARCGHERPLLRRHHKCFRRQDERWPRPPLQRGRQSHGPGAEFATAPQEIAARERAWQ
jgi:hypothetical protein